MNKAFIWIIILLILVAGVLWFMDRPAGEPSAPQGGEDAQTMVVPLSAQNDSGMSGSATLIDLGDSTRVELSLEGAPEDQAQPAHIHAGSCADLGGVEYPLESPVNGVSETMLDVSLDALTGGQPLAVNVHKSPEEIEVYVACGDLLQ